MYAAAREPTSMSAPRPSLLSVVAGCLNWSPNTSCQALTLASTQRADLPHAPYVRWMRRHVGTSPYLTTRRTREKRVCFGVEDEPAAQSRGRDLVDR